MNFEVTLKQTHNENGSVTATRPQEMAVRIQPHSPIPSFDSSAENYQKGRLLILKPAFLLLFCN